MNQSYFVVNGRDERNNQRVSEQCSSAPNSRGVAVPAPDSLSTWSSDFTSTDISFLNNDREQHLPSKTSENFQCGNVKKLDTVYPQIKQKIESNPNSEGTTNFLQKMPKIDEAAAQKWIYPLNYPMRDYQHQIVLKALFSNTLVTLPTGLGKTLIAAVVMYNFYRWFPDGKVVFLAPTKPLVAQQIRACHNVMGIPTTDTAEMQGSISPDQRRILWHERRVFYCTPQSMDNDLKTGALDASALVCLVIDEAHRATGNYAYVSVVQKVCEYTSQFRILALSATPGSDTKSVQTVIRNLRIATLEVRTEEDPEIIKYTHTRQIEVIRCQLGTQLQGITQLLKDVLQPLLNKLASKGVAWSRNTSSVTPYAVLKMKENFLARNACNKSGAVDSKLVEAELGLLMKLVSMQQHLETHGFKDMASRLRLMENEKKQRIFRSRPQIEMQNSPEWALLLESVKAEEKGVGKERHPKLVKLREVLIEHFERYSASGKSTRAIVFTQYRSSVDEIVCYLSDILLLRVAPFIGQSNGKLKKSSSMTKSNNSEFDFELGSVDTNTDVKLKGQTQKEQKAVISDFFDGKFNCLVATCIAEEGLDIGEVDLIISFDALGSPVRMVQRMGRTGRKRAGKVIVLVTEGSEEAKLRSSGQKSRNISRALSNASEKFELMTHFDPHMVPPHITPVMEMREMIIGEYRLSQVGGQKHGLREAAGKRKNKAISVNEIDSKSWQLTEEEYKILQEDYSDDKCNSTYIPDPIFGWTKQCERFRAYNVSKSLRSTSLLDMQSFIDNKEWEVLYGDSDWDRTDEASCKPSSTHATNRHFGITEKINRNNIRAGINSKNNLQFFTAVDSNYQSNACNRKKKSSSLGGRSDFERWTCICGCRILKSQEKCGICGFTSTHCDRSTLQNNSDQEIDYMEEKHKSPSREIACAYLFQDIVNLVPYKNEDGDLEEPIVRCNITTAEDENVSDEMEICMNSQHESSVILKIDGYNNSAERNVNIAKEISPPTETDIYNLKSYCDWTWSQISTNMKAEDSGDEIFPAFPSLSSFLPKKLQVTDSVVKRTYESIYLPDLPSTSPSVHTQEVKRLCVNYAFDIDNTMKNDAQSQQVYVDRTNYQCFLPENNAECEINTLTRENIKEDNGPANINEEDINMFDDVSNSLHNRKTTALSDNESDHSDQDSSFSCSISGNMIFDPVRGNQRKNRNRYDVEIDNEDEDAFCAVCSDFDSSEGNPIIFCDGKVCKLAVHLECYGLSTLPEGHWLCDACVENNVEDYEGICCLCDRPGGALKREQAIPGEISQLAHITCALWTPELGVDKNMVPTHHSYLDLERNILECQVCLKKGGAVVQCCIPSCTRGIHPQCGRDTEYIMLCAYENSLASDYILYCTKHERRGRKELQKINAIFNKAPTNANTENQANNLAHETTPVMKRSRLCSSNVAFTNIELTPIPVETCNAEEDIRFVASDVENDVLFTPVTKSKASLNDSWLNSDTPTPREKPKLLKKKIVMHRKKARRKQSVDLALYRQVIEEEAEVESGVSDDDEDALDHQYDSQDSFINDGHVSFISDNQPSAEKNNETKSSSRSSTTVRSGPGLYFQVNSMNPVKSPEVLIGGWPVNTSRSTSRPLDKYFDQKNVSLENLKAYPIDLCSPFPPSTTTSSKCGRTDVLSYDLPTVGTLQSYGLNKLGSNNPTIEGVNKTVSSRIEVQEQISVPVHACKNFNALHSGLDSVEILATESLNLPKEYSLASNKPELLKDKGLQDLTAEQIKRMEENRKLAELRLQQRSLHLHNSIDCKPKTRNFERPKISEQFADDKFKKMESSQLLNKPFTQMQSIKSILINAGNEYAAVSTIVEKKSFPKKELPHVPPLLQLSNVKRKLHVAPHCAYHPIIKLLSSSYNMDVIVTELEGSCDVLVGPHCALLLKAGSSMAIEIKNGQFIPHLSTLQRWFGRTVVIVMMGEIVSASDDCQARSVGAEIKSVSNPTQGAAIVAALIESEHAAKRYFPKSHELNPEKEKIVSALTGGVEFLPRVIVLQVLEAYSGNKLQYIAAESVQSMLKRVPGLTHSHAYGIISILSAAISKKNM